MCFNALVVGPAVDVDRRRRRGLPLVAALLVIIAVLVAFGAVVFGLGQQGPGTAAAMGPPHFVEEAQAAGVAHAYDGDFSYFVGGGVAAFDCNDDQLPELFFAGGSEPAALYQNTSVAGGALSFSQLVDPVTDLDSVTGAYPLDVDGDGVTDLVVLRYGENVLLRGLGDCRFERANEAWGFDGGSLWSTAFSATWEDGSSWPTIAIGSYHDEAFTDPDKLCQANQFVRPAASQDRFGTPQPLSPSWCSLSMLFTDWDRSGRRDLRVSNDRHYYDEYSGGQDQLWRIEPGAAPYEYTEADGWQTVRVWGMGIASYDVNGDTYPDYYLTSQGDNKLQMLADGPAQPDYKDFALERGVTATRPFVGDVTKPSTAWHDEFEDVNNDGLIDLFVAKGNVEAMPDYAASDPSNLLMGQPDGKFVEGAQQAGIVDFARARGAALTDLNQDGLLDLVVVVRRENVRLYRNVGTGTADAPAPMGNWIAVLPRESGANRDAVGAWVEVRSGDLALSRERTVGGGHVSGQLGPLHFGLAGASTAEVRVTWPDGTVGDWQPVAAGHTYLIDREASSPQVLGQ